jgi:PAS domain S-box-containing protein
MPSSMELAARLSAVVAAQQEILSAITDLGRVLDVIVRTTPEVTAGSGAVVELVDDDQLVYRAASGTAAPHVGLRLSIDRSLSGEAIRERALVRCEDTEIDPRVDVEACRMIGIRSMVIAPLLHGESAIGALKTFSPRANAFDELSVYVVQLLAGICSAAVMQAREFDERRASEERYRMLFERNVAGVFRSTPEGKLLDCNSALADYLGYDSREDLLTHETWEFYPQRADREVFLRSLDRSPALTNVRLHFKRKDGTQMTGVITASMIPTEGGGSQILGTLVPAV